MAVATLAKTDLTSPQATAALAAHLGSRLRHGDVLGLFGPVGAGKSHFARALIQAAQAEAGQPPEDVPSPTFTLVQTYQAGDREIWHCDLYRLADPSEAFELGLDAAFETAICLVEWPDRLGTDWPEARALHLSFTPGVAEDTRHLAVQGAPDWQPRLLGVFT